MPHNTCTVNKVALEQLKYSTRRGDVFTGNHTNCKVIYYEILRNFLHNINEISSSRFVSSASSCGKAGKFEEAWGLLEKLEASAMKDGQVQLSTTLYNFAIDAVSLSFYKYDIAYSHEMGLLLYCLQL